MKSPPAKKPSTPIRLRSFGGVTELRFDDGGYARVRMDTAEINRLIEAMERYVLRRQKIPDPKLLAALDRLHEFLSVGGRGHGICVIADVPIGATGVRLEPIP